MILKDQLPINKTIATITNCSFPKTLETHLKVSK